MVVEVDWTDRAGTPLMQRQSLRINHSADFIPEGGQSLVTAQQEVIERIAREIVGQMETPWFQPTQFFVLYYYRNLRCRPCRM